jgi:TonB family protein
MKKLIIAALFCGFAQLAFAGTSSTEKMGPDLTQCRVMTTVAPEYPADLRRTGETGTVLVCAGIDAGGHVVGVKVLQAENQAFADAAVDAVRQWTFCRAEDPASPAIRRVEVPIRFELSGVEETGPVIPLPETVIYGSADCGIVKTVSPTYPKEMCQRGSNGTATLCATINPSGKVVGIRVLEADNSALAESAREALSEWQFVPLSDPDVYTLREVEIPFRFVMAGS